MAVNRSQRFNTNVSHSNELERGKGYISHTIAKQNAPKTRGLPSSTVNVSIPQTATVKVHVYSIPYKNAVICTAHLSVAYLICVFPNHIRDDIIFWTRCVKISLLFVEIAIGRNKPRKAPKWAGH